MGSVSIVAALVGSTAYAQDTATAGGDDKEFLGTVDIGESTRSVQTNTATPKTVINREEIEERQASTIAELLDSIPGVTLLNGSTPIGSGINIRGFGANGTYGTDQKVLVMVDGATSGSEELYRIGTQLFTDPLLYKQAEVIRGTVGSFEYGSGVIGGVVRLETSDASDILKGKTGFAVNESLTGQTNGDGFVTSTTAAFMPSETIELMGNYTYRQQETLTDGHGDKIGNSAFKLPSFLVKGAVHFGADNAHTIKVSYNQTTTSDRDVPYDSFGTTNFGNVDRDTKTRTVTAAYTYKPVDNDFVDLSLVYTYADQQIDQQAVPAADNALLNADQRYQTTKITLKNAALFTTGSVRHNLRAGLEYIHRDRKDANSAPGGTDNRMAAFVVYEVTPLRGFTLSPAARWETQSIKGTLDNGSPASYTNEALMGGVSVRYELPFGLAAFGSWARTESLPILDDLQTPAYMTQSEKSRSWEGGLSFDRVSLLTQNDHLAIKVNYYDTKLTDNTSYSGVAEVYLDGFEIEASYAVPSGIYVDFNGTIVHGTRLRTNGVIDDWTNLPANNYQLAIGKRFGRVFDIRWEGVLAADREINGTVHEGYNVHNLRASWFLKGGTLDGLTVRVSAENIFDKFYTPALATRPAAGRNFKLTLSKQF
ncbi:TonB-dependent receptor plug [Novosphingobium sp. Rr 2-17]|uniref:TonB-dependent receptor plug domain-containing protein n=1 Tax=Novosphingobium sp. Rr 2-17 TaxID=555793 RepID=UPI000269AADE|nr:TonB-dependent receptor plug domain-containing protein [Novosphingobium sp. Rr 2-17]EIZ81150.1 TonB-dependent receptor plug [Novosphingobium sp. Rr 2-17]